MNFIIAATVTKDDDGKRADRIFRRLLGKMPLSRIYREIRSGFLRINGKKVKEDTRVSEGDTVDIAPILMEFAENEEEKKELAHELNSKAFRKRIVYEDEDILVVNKKKGELVHSDGTRQFTPLDQQVREYLSDIIPDSISFTPGPLHRLDRNTSGIIVFGKSARGAREFSAALQNRLTRKCYVALLDGKLTGVEYWEDHLVRDEGKNTTYVSKDGKGDLAITIASPFLESGGKTLAQIEIKTGRTHQIRCQASYHHHPLTGDAKYHGSPNREGYYLCSCIIKVGWLTLKRRPDYIFMREVARLMGCDESEVRSAVEKIISSFIAEK